MKIRLMGDPQDVDRMIKKLQGTVDVSWSQPYKCRNSTDVRVYGDVLEVTGGEDVAFESRTRETETETKNINR